MNAPWGWLGKPDSLTCNFNAFVVPECVNARPREARIVGHLAFFFLSNNCTLRQSDATDRSAALPSTYLIRTARCQRRLRSPRRNEVIKMVGLPRHPLTSPRNRSLRYVILGVLFLGTLYWLRGDRSDKNRFRDVIGDAAPKTWSSASHSGLGGLAPPIASHEDMRSSSTHVGTRNEKKKRSAFVDLRKTIPWTTFDGGESCGRVCVMACL